MNAVTFRGGNCMRQYKMQETKEVYKIICNKCGKEIFVKNGIAEEDVLSVEKRWGYFSNKDNEIHEFDLCESCYDEFVKTFVISVK